MPAGYEDACYDLCYFASPLNSIIVLQKAFIILSPNVTEAQQYPKTAC